MGVVCYEEKKNPKKNPINNPSYRDNENGPIYNKSFAKLGFNANNDSSLKHKMVNEIDNNENQEKNRDKYSTYKKEIFEYHNKMREIHWKKPYKLKEDELLSEKAQRYADECAEFESKEHSPILLSNKNVGEIVFEFDKDIAGISQKFNIILNKEQKVFYEKGNKKYYCSDTKNYTQVIWKKTTNVGFGISQSAKGKIYFVGLYEPPGNIFEEFENNVYKK